MNFKELLKDLPATTPAPPKPHVIVPAIRSHGAISNIVQLRCEIDYHYSLKSWWVYVRNGVTGYESAQVKLLLNDARNRWPACAGTPGRWDSLVIEREGMDILRKWLREQPELQNIDQES